MLEADIPFIRYFYILALCVVYAILVYCTWHRFPNKDAERADDTWTGQSVAEEDPAAVPDAAIATNFQLLSVFPNVSFGISGLLIIPLLNVFGFLAGNFITRLYLGKILSAIESHQTPHLYIASSHGMPGLRRKTALISLAVFASVTCFEIVYLSRVSGSLLGDNHASYYVLVGMLTIATIVVAIVGRLKTTLSADRWLLIIAYVGIHLVVGFLSSVRGANGENAAVLIVLVLLLIMCYYRWMQFNQRAARGSWRHLVILASTFILVLALCYAIFSRSNPAALANGIVASLSPSDAGLSTDVFWLALFAALCPSVFYNFVDFSFWQKYSSEVRNAEPATSMKKRVAKSFWIYVFESPLSWLLPVILGAYAISLEDATANLANPIPFIVVALSSEGWFGSICSVLFYASLVAIATSTACGYLVAMGYLYDADIKCSRSAPHSDGHDGISGDFFLVGLGAVLIVVLLPVDMLTETAEQLIVLMLTCFAPLCALTPLVVWPMVKGHVNLQPRGKAGVTAALGFGSAIGIVTGVAAWAMASETRSLLYWAPLPLSFFVSWSIYVFSVLFWKERAVAGGVVNGRGP